MICDHWLGVFTGDRAIFIIPVVHLLNLTQLLGMKSVRQEHRCDSLQCDVIVEAIRKRDGDMRVTIKEITSDGRVGASLFDAYCYNGVWTIDRFSELNDKTSGDFTKWVGMINQDMLKLGEVYYGVSLIRDMLSYVNEKRKRNEKRPSGYLRHGEVA
jgi:hypothetical protein